MNLNTFPTKGNLILAKNSLALASQGYELMDKKRNILLRELMGLIDQAKDIQAEIDTTFTEGQYRAGNRFYPGYCWDDSGGRYDPHQDPQHHGNGDSAGAA